MKNKYCSPIPAILIVSVRLLKTPKACQKNSEDGTRRARSCTSAQPKTPILPQILRLFQGQLRLNSANKKKLSRFKSKYCSHIPGILIDSVRLLKTPKACQKIFEDGTRRARSCTCARPRYYPAPEKALGFRQNGVVPWLGACIVFRPSIIFFKILLESPLGLS